jgi:hypothetical protein
MKMGFWWREIMAVNNIEAAFKILKIFADVSKGVIYSMESNFDRTDMLKTHLQDALYRLQDVLEEMSK